MIAEIKVYSTKNIGKLVLYSSIFVLMSLMILAGDSTNLAGWIGLIVFGGPTLPIVIWTLIDKKPHLILNEKGLYYRWHKQKFFEWSLIQSVYIAEMYSPYICVKMKAGFEPSTNKNWLYKGYWGISKSMGFQEVNISTGNLEVDTIKLLRFMNLMLNAAPGERIRLMQIVDLKPKEPQE